MDVDGAEAKRCILLAGTDPDSTKHRGISFFVMDMDSPGLEVRPIKNAVGESEFCEMFLTDVVIPAANLIGAENDGWAVSQQTLGSERAVVLVGLAELLRLTRVTSSSSRQPSGRCPTERQQLRTMRFASRSVVFTARWRFFGFS